MLKLFIHLIYFVLKLLYCSLASTEELCHNFKTKRHRSFPVKSNGIEMGSIKIQEPELDFIQIDPILNRHTNNLFGHFCTYLFVSNILFKGIWVQDSFLGFNTSHKCLSHLLFLDGKNLIWLLEMEGTDYRAMFVRLA